VPQSLEDPEQALKSEIVVCADPSETLDEEVAVPLIELEPVPEEAAALLIVPTLEMDGPVLEVELEVVDEVPKVLGVKVEVWVIVVP
jgi:hypothetical protein